MTTNWDISKTLNTLISEKNEIFRELQCVIVVWRQMRTFAVVYGEKIGWGYDVHCIVHQHASVGFL